MDWIWMDNGWIMDGMDNGLSDKYDTEIGRILGREYYRPRRTIHIHHSRPNRSVSL